MRERDLQSISAHLDWWRKCEERNGCSTAISKVLQNAPSARVGLEKRVIISNNTRWVCAQVVEWLDMHYGDENRERMKKIKARFQKHDPSADMGL